MILVRRNLRSIQYVVRLGGDWVLFIGLVLAGLYGGILFIGI